VGVKEKNREPKDNKTEKERKSNREMKDNKTEKERKSNRETKDNKTDLKKNLFVKCGETLSVLRQVIIQSYLFLSSSLFSLVKYCVFL
jgi:sulfite reductase alpha subunit-like flavoprotein